MSPVQSEEIPAQYIEPPPRPNQPVTPPLPHFRPKPMNEQPLHPKNPLRPLETKGLQTTHRRETNRAEPKARPIPHKPDA